LQALAHTKSVEQLHYMAPGEWGDLLGAGLHSRSATLRQQLEMPGGATASSAGSALHRFPRHVKRSGNFGLAHRTVTHQLTVEQVRQAGLQLMELLMQEETRELVGERSQRQAERTANRWGSEQGYCVVMGQKVPVKRPRVRTVEDKEVRLGSYEMFHRGEPLTETVFEGQQMVAALGIGQDAWKTILGIRQGATENATVVGELLGDLVSRGLDFTQPRLYVLDGGKALTTAVKKYAGESAAIQRCQVHKRRNVPDHLTDEQQPAVAKRLNAAYALEDYAAAKQALNQLHRELMDLNPSAARSLGEGMEETLTVHRLHVPMQLRKTLASTNVIESAFSIVERVCRNVKRWHDGDQRERWVGSGLLVAQKQFRRITGYKQIPALIRELETLTPSKKAVVKSEEGIVEVGRMLQEHLAAHPPVSPQ
jgi:Transposase, Mutator family